MFHFQTNTSFWAAGLAFVLLSCCAISCNADNTPAEKTVKQSSPPPLLTSLKMDSIRVYPLGKISGYSTPFYIFSPLDNNRIWVMPGREESFELNLETGRKTLLSDKFNHDFFKDRLQTYRVVPDSTQTSLCWFFNRKGEIFRYDKARGTGLLFDLAGNHDLAVLHLLQTANEVWVGTSKGLWRYDRMSGQCHHVDNSPQISMGYLAMDSRGRILTGGNYAYDPMNGCWELSGENPDRIPGPDPQYNTPFDLPTSRVSYQFARNGNEVWACNPYYWVMNEQTSGKTTIYASPFPAMPVSIRADANHIFGLYNDTFLVVSRTFLANKFMGDQQIIAKWKRFGHLADSLAPQESDTWANRKLKINFLKQQFGNSDDKEIAFGVNFRLNRFYSFRDENKMEQVLEDKDVEASIAGDIYEGRLNNQVRNGRLHKALKTFQVFKERFPDDHFFDNTYGWEFVTAAIDHIDELDRAGLAPDKLLWNKGEIMADLCMNCPYFAQEGCYDLSLADSVYRLLIKKFPESDYADNADYELVENSFCHACEDGSDHPEEVVAWKKFLNRHPDSEKKPDALMHITWALGRTEDDFRKGLKYLSEAAKLQPEWLTGVSEESKHFLSVRQEFQQQLDVFEMQVSVVLKKRKVRRGEPVELTFVLKNTGAKSKTARLWQLAGYPNFSVDIQQQGADSSCVRPLIFEYGVANIYPRNAADFKEIVLKSGESYRESWDIARTALKSYDARVGYFIFDQPGKFRIWAKCENGMGKMDEPVLLEVE